MANSIHTERLYLRDLTDEDLDHVHQLKSDDRIWQYSTQAISKSIDDSKDYLSKLLSNYEQSISCFQGLFLVENDTFIGEAGEISHNSRSNRSTIGYNLLPGFWNKGYATEISKGIVQHLFDIKKVERVEALVIEGNIGSKKVLEKTGFKLEGILRNFGHKNNVYFNVHYYGMIRDDFYK